MLKTSNISLVPLLLALCFTAPAFAEEDATMHQVYLAAESGKLEEAQSMMDKVLRDHPNSAKAHFVEAELLAKQGLFGNAAIELNTAERLQPGLPFVKPETLQKLKSRISSATNTGVMHPNIARVGTPSTIKEWLPAILLILAIGSIILLTGLMIRRNIKTSPANSYGISPGANMPASGANGYGTVMGQSSSGGMGSGIMGSLATGAAMGAGVVAGEALMNHFLDGDRNNAVNQPSFHDDPSWNSSSNIVDNDDMGGADFGIADASSWDDDSASDGGDDWT
ncbi:MAG: hypothetical protein PHY54_14025 [Methylococcales bacterium]|nr:hypothetical protein [Methylococcales bacterium]